jgi:hypothetical protein
LSSALKALDSRTGSKIKGRASAQGRLTATTPRRRLTAVGKKRPLVIAAIAREMAAFLWAIAQHVAPAANREPGK